VGVVLAELHGALSEHLDIKKDLGQGEAKMLMDPIKKRHVEEVSAMQLTILRT
jgi:hypothetical protein